MYELPKLPRQRLLPTPRGLALLLAALVALGPLSLDTYLPSFGDIAASLQATSLQVQQTLTTYLLSFSLATLCHGAIADAVGRRRVLLHTVAFFGLASLGCMLATSIEQLWGLRALQGITASAGIVVGRAIVRDIYEGPAAQRLVSQITMIFAVAPVIAPVIGGWLQALFGWRSVFAFLTLIGVALWVVCWFRLPETLPRYQRQSLRPRFLAGSYRKVLTCPPFLLICAALTLNFAAFFLYVVAAPVFLMRHLGVSSIGFLWLYGPTMGGLLLGSWLAGRLADKMLPRRLIAIGYLLMSLAAGLNIVLTLATPPALPWSVLPLAAFTFGMALVMPCLTLMALDIFPQQRGLAASCQLFLQAAFNAVVAGVVAPLLWDSTILLALGMGGLMLLGGLAMFVHQRLATAAAAQLICLP